MRLFLLFVLALHCSVCVAQLAPLRITTLKSVASIPSNFYISPFDPTIIVDANGYSPKIPAKYLLADNGLYVREHDTQVVWNFGDGSPEKNAGNRSGVSHIYKDPGQYTVKVKLLDGDNKVFQQATSDIVIEPKVPRVVYSAVPLTPEEPTRLSFTAGTFGRELHEDEVLNYRWDFGDGTTREGENLNAVNHTYASGGKYKTTLTVTGKYGEDDRRKTIRVVAASDEQKTLTDEELAKPDAIANEVNVQVSGQIGGELKASAQKMAGVTFMAPKKNGNCQLWVNFWDDTQLTHGSILLNLGVLPGNTSNYTFRGQNRFDMYFFPDSKQYLIKKRTFMAGKTAPAFGGPMHSFDSEALFRMFGGSIKLTVKNGDYVVGSINASLKGHLRSSKKEDKDKMLIGVNGDFSVDLSAQGIAREAIAKGLQCAEQEFTEIRRFPEAGEKHFIQTRPVMRIKFSEDINPDSVSDDTFQLGYPDANGNFVRASGRFIHDPSRIQFVPDKSLRQGVRYSMRLKVGEKGVRSTAGSFIDDTDGTGWSESEFWTKLPFSSDANTPSNLSCDVYQSVKNAPLIAGKAALMKVYADWPKFTDVHTDAQYKGFDALIKLSDSISQPLGAQSHAFTRPDLRSGWSKAKLRKDEAAQHPFIPLPNSPHLFVGLEAKTNNSKNSKSNYYFYCATPTWDKAPELSVDVFAMNYGNYGFDAKSKEYTELSDAETMPVLKRILKDAKTYAEQVYPVKSLKMSEPKLIDVPQPLGLEPGCGYECWMTALSRHLGAANFCDPGAKDVIVGAISNEASHWDTFIKSLRDKSSADLIVLLGPHDIFLGGGRAVKTLSSGQGLVYMTAGNTQDYFDRYVFGLVHEIGHAMTLEHTPIIDGCSRGELMKGRGSNAAQEYQGLDGIRLSADGVNWWHKSSRLGNEQSKNMMPLMYPGTVSQDDAFILRNEYRSIQVLLEGLP